MLKDTLPLAASFLICSPGRLLRRRAIRAAFKNRQRGAVLTTHYMEEAEAVCDRVAIMVAGQLRLVPLLLYSLHFPSVSTDFSSTSHSNCPPSHRQVHRLHPASKGEVRSGLQPGGEAAGGADGPPAGGAVAQRNPPNLPPCSQAGEVRTEPERFELTAQEQRQKVSKVPPFKRLSDPNDCRVVSCF